jgi:hypothetical protein
MSEPQLSVIIPNYKTPELTKICLRLLRKYSDPGQIKVIVIDNASGDSSIEYLRTLKWIKLIERQVSPDESGPAMHALALDEAFACVDTPFVMIMHTDTFMLRPDWTDYLLKQFTSDRVAGVGSWKLEPPKSLIWRLAHSLEEKFRTLSGRKTKQEIRYLRSHCAVYRSDLVRKYTNGFYDNESAGKNMHLKLEAAGYDMSFLPSDDLGRYICHLNHATMILNPASSDRKTGKAPARIKLSRKMQMFMDVLDSQDLDL